MNSLPVDIKYNDYFFWEATAQVNLQVVVI